MIQLITMLKRKPGTTHEEFLTHWHDQHGPLIKRLSCANYVRRYEQHASVWPAPGSKMPEPKYDGVTIQWFDSADAFYAPLTEPDQAEMFEDVKRFLDTSALEWTICEAPSIVIGDDTMGA
ncbi:MAG: ethyl tert-butyl ether degradation protein EthD [Acidimicrobiales bacterium]|nr:ethyl tert-butyl ether degradation protein EthD [Acidimicrobiales bacterium]